MHFTLACMISGLGCFICPNFTEKCPANSGVQLKFQANERDLERHLYFTPVFHTCICHKQCSVYRGNECASLYYWSDQKYWKNIRVVSLETADFFANLLCLPVFLCTEIKVWSFLSTARGKFSRQRWPRAGHHSKHLNRWELTEAMKISLNAY